MSGIPIGQITRKKFAMVRVEEGAHVACVELILGAVPSVEDALGDRGAKKKGNKEVEGRRACGRVAQPAAARPGIASVATVEESDGA
eukprot:scaffold61249_cov64-Phaeocystis_antarctica.AAC.2